MLKKILLLLISIPLVSETIVVDGELTEQEWQSAFKITEFYETDPYTLKKTDEETIAYIFSNEDGIYVGFINYQDESTMLSNKTMRDEISSLSEKNSINIDFDGDRSKAYIIAVALGDSLFDAIKIQSGGFKTDWDGDWIAKTKKFENYWSSEFYLPWNVVLMNQPNAKKRKINYSALRYKANEQSWSSSAGTMATRADYFLQLDTLELDNFTKSKFNVFPYFAYNKNSPTDFEESNAGAEIFYSSGRGSQINLTINPDFGQAESDEVIVNFSAQETFYKEKRAFFNENQSLFDISNYDRYSVINTRRIGARPTYDCSMSSDEEACNDAKKNYSDIDYSFRFTQKNDLSNYGLFVAQESDEAFSKGRKFIALRGKTKIDSRSFGYMVTNVENDIAESESTVNVIDYINVRSKKLTTYADLLTTKKNDETGKGMRLQYTYKPSDLTRNSASFLYFDKDFQINDFGYLKKSDWMHFGLGHNIKKIDYKIDDYDTAMFILCGSDGKQCLIKNSRTAVYGYDQRVELLGSKGMLQSDNIKTDQMKYFRDSGTEISSPYLHFFIERYQDAFSAQLLSFINAVELGQPPAVGFEDGYKALIIAEAAYLAIKKGAKVPINYNW